jgi:beta-N-acetylglucosaminidase
MPSNPLFLSGVIEGFYGPLWTRTQRLELFDSMQRWGLNTYVYGPKDDLHHRLLWRETYPDAESADLGELITECQARGIQFLYALGPGLDIRYGSSIDCAALEARLSQLMDLGCRTLCLLFDDIPDTLHSEDAARWDSLAAAQCSLTNHLLQTLNQRGPLRLLFCPTPYCHRMMQAEHGGKGYLEIVGRQLHPSIDVFWTGPEIISEEITVEQIQALTQILQRKPILWDNLYANDYDGRRVFFGPYAGRSPELRSQVAGVLCNPNTEFPVNYAPLHTFASWLRSTPQNWEPRLAYLDALRDWLPRLASAGKSITPVDLVLFCDSFYLPYSQGPTAARFYDSIATLLSNDPSTWTEDKINSFLTEAQRLRNFCVQISEVEDRTLFAALSRRVWELREELELLIRYVQFQANPLHRGSRFRSDFHQPKVYRGGFVPALQGLLRLEADGSFTPIPTTEV